MPYSTEPVIKDKTQKDVGGSDATDKTSADTILSDYSKPFSDYKEVAQTAIKEVMGLWEDEITQTTARRNLRNIKINTDDERRKKTIEEDEIFAPVRLIDTNIVREQAKYAQYLTKPTRDVVLTCNEDSALDTTIIERDFTQKARYNGWEIPPLKTIDGMETHGWDSVEILLDTSKAGHFAVEHISHENLIFPTDTKDFQSAPFVIRLCEYTTQDLVKFAKKRGWNPAQVKKVLDGKKNDKKVANVTDTNDMQKKNGDNKNYRLNRVEKVFFRDDNGFINVAWSCAEFCDEWLREPKLLFNGVVGKDQQTGEVVKYYETAYPIEPFLYRVSENEVLMDTLGRVAMDEHKQEAATSLLSSFLTSHRRAAQLYFVADGPNDGTPIDEAQTNIKLKPGKVFKANLKQFQLNPPSEGILNGVNTIIGQSQMESGDVNYAIQSNKSTRKTSKEVSVAQDESQLLSSVQTSLLSIAMRNVRTVCFNIYQSRVTAGLISVTQNVYDMLSQYTFIVKPAGDTDVIERQQKIQLMMQAWEIYSHTGAQSVFLQTLTRLLFPDEADLYIKAFQNDDQKNQLLQKLMALLQSLIIDPQTGQIHPEYQQYTKQLQQLQQQITAAIQPMVGSGPAVAVPAGGSVSGNVGNGNGNMIDVTPQKQLNQPPPNDNNGTITEPSVATQ
jgi:hypothetical protein